MVKEERKGERDTDSCSSVVVSVNGAARAGSSGRISLFNSRIV